MSDSLNNIQKPKATEITTNSDPTHLSISDLDLGPISTKHLSLTNDGRITTNTIDDTKIINFCPVFQELVYTIYEYMLHWTLRETTNLKLHLIK